MISNFFKILKNKTFLISLLIANGFIFGVGLYFYNTDLILLSGMSYATVLLSMGLNEDENKKESIDTHNTADQLIYQTESQIKEAGDKISDDEKKPIEDAVEQLKQANGGSDVDAIKTAIENLNKAWEPVSQKMYQAAQQEAQTPPNGADANTDANEMKAVLKKVRQRLLILRW